MSQIIVHHKNAYNIYGTIADGAYFESALTLKQLKIYIKKEFGEQGLRNLPQRLEMAHQKGTSCISSNSLEDTLLCNRAGKNERHMSTKAFIKKFLTL